MPFVNLKHNQLLQKLIHRVQRSNITPEFVKNTRFQAWTVVIALNMVLALLLAPDIHLFRPGFKVGSIATSDIRADRDLLVEDRAATEKKKFEMMKDVPAIYDYDSNMAIQINKSVSKGFTIASQLYTKPDSAALPPAAENVRAAGQNHLKQARKGFEDALGITLTDDEFNILHKYRFASFLSEKISKLISSVYFSELITNVTFLRQDTDNGIIIRNIITQEEREEKNLSEIIYINKVDSIIAKKASVLLDTERRDVNRLLLSLSRKIIQPNLTFNRNATEKKKQAVAKDLGPVYFQVQKDEMIVREGQKMTDTDLDKLDAYFNIKGEKRFSNVSIFAGIFLMITALGVALHFIARNLIKSERHIRDTVFLSIATLLQIILVKMGIFISYAVNRAFPFISPEVCFYAIPFTVGSMLVGVLINQNIALIISVFISLLVAFLFDSKIFITLFAFLGCVVASYRVFHCKKRTAFFRIGLVIGFVNCVAILFISLIQGNAATIDTLIKLIMGVAGGIISGIIIAGITPLFETIFDYTTDIKLLELGNLNQPIFQQMIMEAPGTYHHSIVVASLVEAAAESIGANSLLAKVSAYYHDIGKIRKPQYFIENQRNGENKHDRLSPKMSGLIIISHVKDGYELAGKIKLGRQIMNVIREHHGTGLVSYFYDKSRKDKDSSIRSLPESDFRYPGPKPQSREAGLVLLGDVIEASSRTLSNPTPSRLKNLVRDRFERVFMDGQLDECELTLRDLNKIAESFTRILNGIFHHRIDYPEPVVMREVTGIRKENNGDTDRKSAEKNRRKYGAGPTGAE